MDAIRLATEADYFCAGLQTLYQLNGKRISVVMGCVRARLSFAIIMCVWITNEMEITKFGRWSGYYYYYYYYLLQVIYKAKQPVTPDQQVKKYK